MYITPHLGGFSMLGVSTVVGTAVRSAGAKKARRWEHLAESFLKTYVSFRIGTLLVVEQSGLEKRRGGGVTYTVVTRY